MSKITSVEKIVENFYKEKKNIWRTGGSVIKIITEEKKLFVETLINRDKEIIEFAEKNKFFDSWGIEVVYLDDIITALTETKHE